MNRIKIDFETFKKHYIKYDTGFYPVYASFAENGEGEPIKTLDIDMICEWRLNDGIIRFLSVPFHTKEQFEEIISYLSLAANLLNKSIIDNINGLSYPGP